MYGAEAEALKLSEVVEVTGVLCNVPDGTTLAPHDEEWMAEEHAATHPPMSQVRVHIERERERERALREPRLRLRSAFERPELRRVPGTPSWACWHAP